MWPWRVKIDTTSLKVLQPFFALPVVVSFDSHDVDIGTKQKHCCFCWKIPKDMLLNVNVGTKQKQCCFSWNIKKTCCWCRTQKSHVVGETTYFLRGREWGSCGHGVKKVIWPIFSPFQTILGRKLFHRFFSDHCLALSLCKQLLLLNFVQVGFV